MELMIQGMNDIQARRWLEELEEAEQKEFSEMESLPVPEGVKHSGQHKDTYRICPVCGKQFWQSTAAKQWAYKVPGRKSGLYITMCSYSCMQEAKKEKEARYKKHMEETREERSRKAKERWKTT